MFLYCTPWPFINDKTSFVLWLQSFQLLPTSFSWYLCLYFKFFLHIQRCLYFQSIRKKTLIYWISHLLSVSKTLQRAIFKYLWMVFMDKKIQCLRHLNHITTKPVSSLIISSPDSRCHIQQMFLKSISIKSVAPKTATANTRIYIECTSATKDKFKILPLWKFD